MFLPSRFNKGKGSPLQNQQNCRLQCPRGKFNKLSSAFDWLVNIHNVFGVRLRKKKNLIQQPSSEKKSFLGANKYRNFTASHKKDVFAESLKNKRGLTLQGKQTRLRVCRQPLVKADGHRAAEAEQKLFQTLTKVPVRPWARRECFHRMKSKRKLFLS